MTPPPAFRLFGPTHLLVVLLTIAIPVGLGLAVRQRPSRRADRAVAICLALILAVNYLAYGIYLWSQQLLYWKQALPFQLCDWAMVTVIVALLTERPHWIEVSYFWGIGGTFQAILTPNLQTGFPDVRVISFFVGHCGIVVGILYLLIARRFRITLMSVWRTLAWSELYLLVTLLADYLTGVNYGFLLHRPPVSSLLDYLPDNHLLYLLGLNVLGLAFFALLYLPFAIARLAKSSQGPLSVR